MSLSSDLETYLRAGYPYLALETFEEERALRVIQQAAQATSLALVPLSMSRMGADDTKGMRPLLDRIEQQSDAAIFVLLDMHPWLDDPLVCRRLRDLGPRLVERRQSVLFLSPECRIPRDLESDIVCFELARPDAAELRVILEQQLVGLESSLSEELATRAVRAVRGMTAEAAKRAFRRVWGHTTSVITDPVAELIAEKRRILRRSDLLHFVDAPPSLDSVGGLESLKEWLVEREAAFTQRAREFGLPTPKGLLLVGVQGCGKSLSAKAVASLWRLPLARLELGSLFTHGHSPEQNLKRVIAVSEALAPMVLWIDEIDKAFAAISTDKGSESLARIFGSFITWLQEKRSSAFVVATANSVENLPGELLRKGRFDETFFVDLPNTGERTQILRIHVTKHGRDPQDFDLESLAADCDSFAGSELEQVVVSGLYRAFQSGRELQTKDMQLAAKEIVPLARTCEEQIKGLREWARRCARRASPDARLLELWGDTT